MNADEDWHPRRTRRDTKKAWKEQDDELRHRASLEAQSCPWPSLPFLRASSCSSWIRSRPNRRSSAFIGGSKCRSVAHNEVSFGAGAPDFGDVGAAGLGG